MSITVFRVRSAWKCLLICPVIVVKLASAAEYGSSMQINLRGKTKTTTEVSEKHAGKHWVVRIETRRKPMGRKEIDQVMGTPSVYTFGIGDYNSRHPNHTVSRISFTCGSRPFRDLALSSFSDLYNPSSAKIQIAGDDRIVLHLRGGDGGFSYSAELENGMHAIVARRVATGLPPVGCDSGRKSIGICGTKHFQITDYIYPPKEPGLNGNCNAAL
jgi:hypothetical protein